MTLMSYLQMFPSKVRQPTIRKSSLADLLTLHT